MIGACSKINAISLNVKINKRKSADICGYKLPINVQNFMQKDSTWAKISSKVVGGSTFFTHPVYMAMMALCWSADRIGLHVRVDRADVIVWYSSVAILMGGNIGIYSSFGWELWMRSWRCRLAGGLALQKVWWRTVSQKQFGAQARERFTYLSVWSMSGSLDVAVSTSSRHADHADLSKSTNPYIAPNDFNLT